MSYVYGQILHRFLDILASFDQLDPWASYPWDLWGTKWDRFGPKVSNAWDDFQGVHLASHIYIYIYIYIAYGRHYICIYTMGI